MTLLHFFSVVEGIAVYRVDYREEVLRALLNKLLLNIYQLHLVILKLILILVLILHKLIHHFFKLIFDYLLLDFLKLIEAIDALKQHLLGLLLTLPLLHLAILHPEPYLHLKRNDLLLDAANVPLGLPDLPHRQILHDLAPQVALHVLQPVHDVEGQLAVDF